MDKLESKLRSDLLANPAISIKKLDKWHLPIVTYDVTFKRVKRSKMDILMKMMLLTFEQTDIRRAANISEYLLVEELFIEDLLKKMQRMGLIHFDNTMYKLTSKGREQLNSGIFVEELDEEVTELSYSRVHDEILLELEGESPAIDEQLPRFRYYNMHDILNAERILEVLTEREDVIEEDGFQTIVSEVISFVEQNVEFIPCIEFQLYNTEQDIYYARVWNSFLGRWDDVLEKKIEEKEQIQWREKYSTP